MTKNDDVAIRVNHVAKDFYLPHENSNSIKTKIVRLFDKKDRGADIQHALKDVSFEVKKGEFFGIVGRNGGGKSTLLKIIAEIYKPTKGSVEVNGRLVPFIELGVGFNPELTGRENVYLNGALLGFTRPEIDAQYDDIVKFAGLKDFMDQKLKNYSSGMQVRLAFSVAIRAESDILMLDEVLAVGDEAFQRKCNEYFLKAKKEGKTVVLVTHSMEAVRRFCTRAIYIRDGGVVVDGTPQDVANQYTEDNFEKSTDDSNSARQQVDNIVRSIQVIPESKQVLSHNNDVKFSIEYEISDDRPVRVFFSILDEKRGGSILANGTEPISGAGRHKVTYVFPLKYFNSTDLLVVAAIDDSVTKERIAHTNDDSSCRFAIRNSESDNGLLRRDNGIHGHWIGHKDYMYNLEEE